MLTGTDTAYYCCGVGLYARHDPNLFSSSPVIPHHLYPPCVCGICGICGICGGGQAIGRQHGALNDIAQLPTQREMLVRMAGDRAVKSGVAAYNNALQAVIGEGGGLPVEMDTLWGMHVSCQRQALAVFRAEAVLEAEETKE